MNTLLPQYQGLSYQASQPLIGQPQIASYQAGLNTQTGAAQQQILSQLAKSGALNSGRASTALTGLQLGKMNNLSNYLANVPVVNQQNSMQNGLNVWNAGNNFKVPYGTNYGNFSNSWNNAFNNNYATNTNTSSQTQRNSGSGIFGALGI